MTLRFAADVAAGLLIASGAFHWLAAPHGSPSPSRTFDPSATPHARGREVIRPHPLHLIAPPKNKNPPKRIGHCALPRQRHISKSCISRSIGGNALACQHQAMRNLTFTECLLIWRTSSPRLRIGLALWIIGLRRLAVRVTYISGR
jgi:hypothetical protein